MLSNVALACVKDQCVRGWINAGAMFVVQKFLASKLCRGGAIASVVVGMIVFWRAGRAEQPTIAYIDRTNNVVRIHVETPATNVSYKYVLQCTGTNANGAVLTNWSNMNTAYIYPFAYHWIFYDGLTNRSRFYRLKVTP